MHPPLDADALPGHLADNVVHFARVLRAAGLPVGTDRVLLAFTALRAAGIESRRDFHAVLRTSLIDRHEHYLLFDQAFHIFWKDPDLLGQMLRLLLPQVREKSGAPPPPENRRLGDALFTPPADGPRRQAEQQIELDAQLSWSEREQLRKADFDTMTAQEWAQARRMLLTLAPFFERLRTRRAQPAARGSRLDLPAVLRQAARHGGDIVALPRRLPRTRPAPLVALVDISGSMSRYSRMFLHFLHALATADHRLQAFVFGTRLTRVTRQIAARDPDAAVAGVVAAVEDWSGGTRIGATLHAFNQHWGRRVLGQGATVLLVTDGLEHADLDLLARETERLAKSCRRLVWLNPLLRYDAFEPRARGVRAMLAHVDRFLPVHNLDSLLALAEVLAGRQNGPAPARSTHLPGSHPRTAQKKEPPRWN
jgi:uncharacterized protein with von Willebrand factor type A (vWA) domain